MNKFFYAVKDELAGFGSPFVMASDELAKRDFILAVRDPACIMRNSPDDYSLCRLGIFDDSTGEVLPEDGVVKIVGARACLEVSE